MGHSFFAAPGPLAFAHRGGSALAPENTMAAFDRGLALGADGLELDVHLSRDGVVVVHHDRALERTTNLRGMVAERTAAELARANAGYWFRPLADRHNEHASGEFPFRDRGCGIPTLAAVLARYPATRIIIELKVNSRDLARAAVEVVRRAGAVDRVCLGSMASQVLGHVRSMAPEIATSASRGEVRWALYRSWCRWPLSRAPYQGYQVPEWAGRTRVVSSWFVEAAHAARLSVQVWTVDDDEDAARLLGWGVDGLIADRPDLIVPRIRTRRTPC